MIARFAFASATEIRFGRGVSEEAALAATAYGTRTLLVHGANADRANWLARALGPATVRYAVPGEPDVAMIEEGVMAAREAGADVVVALGGGAVIDAGKAIAALVPTTRPMLDHLEIVGQGLPLEVEPLPFIALPTTAGTGAEVTRNAVISVPEARRKVSLRDFRMLPRLAIVDPGLTESCPRATTLASGLDAVTQVIEPFISPHATPLTDALCRDAIPRGLAALRRLMATEGRDARDEMAWVSLCGGLALANSGLGAVHGLAGPLGGLTGAAHGALCGALLPHVLIANRARAEKPYADRIDQVGAWIGLAFGLADAGIDAAASALVGWARDEGLPGLDALGVTVDIRRNAGAAAGSSSSMKANPVPLTEAELEAVMRSAA